MLSWMPFRKGLHWQDGLYAVLTMSKDCVDGINQWKDRQKNGHLHQSRIQNRPFLGVELDEQPSWKDNLAKQVEIPQAVSGQSP